MEVIYQVNNLEDNLVLMVHSCEECDTGFTPSKEMGIRVQLICLRTMKIEYKWIKLKRPRA